MAKFRPLRIGDETHAQRINPATEEIEGKIYVSQPGVVLGRVSSGDGPHEEILFDDLPGGPGGASYTEVTYSEMQALIAANGLTPGGWYLITDASGTDLGFLTNAVNENTPNVQGVGGYRNADFQAVGDYSGTPETFGTQLGIWRTSFEVVTIPYTNLDPAQIEYSTSSGLLTDGEGYTTPYTPPYIYYTGASGLFTAGETITGDDNGSTAEVISDTPNNSFIYYTGASGAFTVGETITGDDNGSTAVVVFDDEVGALEVSGVTGDWTTETTFLGDISANTATYSGYDGGSGTLEVSGVTGAWLSETTFSGGVSGQTASVDGYDAEIVSKTGTVITDSGSIVQIVPNEPLAASDVITGDISGNTVTVDTFDAGGGTFAVGDTITGGTTGATAVIVTDDGAASMTAYMTSPGVAFDGSEMLDNGNGVTADQDGAASSPTIALGDVVIFNLHHWQLTDTTLLNGTDPETNTAAYTLLDKATYPETYVTAWDVSEFDFANNWLQYREDRLGNKYLYTKTFDDNDATFGATQIPFFPFGNNSIWGDVLNNSLFYQQNPLLNIYKNTLYENARIGDNFGVGDIFECILYQSAVISECNIGADSGLDSIVLYQGAEVKNIISISSGGVFRVICQAGGVIRDIILANESALADTAISAGAIIREITTGSGTAIQNNILENGAQLTGITAGANCSISGLKLEAKSVFGGEMIIEDGAQVNDSTILNGIEVSNKTFAAGVEFSGNTIGVPATEIETISDNIIGKRAIPGFSDIPGTIDITGLTTLDITAAWAQYRGIYLLESSNATETIDTITNPPTLFPTILKNNQTGLALTITGTPYAGIDAGQIALKAASYTLNPGEYIVLDYDPATGCLIENRVVNELL